MKIKVVNIILLIPALVFVVVGILFSVSDDSMIFVIGRIPENAISNFSILLAPLLLIVVCVIELIRRIMEHGRGKALIPDFDEDEIEWKDNHTRYMLWVIDYSTYGD